MLQDMYHHEPCGVRPSKSAPCSPLKPLFRTNAEVTHIAHKVPCGDTPYVKAKRAQLVDKNPEKAIVLFWAAINAGDRVDSALKDMAIVMKQVNRAEEAIEAIKSLRNRCSDLAQESLDNILLDLYKRCGKLDEQIDLLKHKLHLINRGVAFNGKRTKTARSQGKKFQISVEQEATRLLGNLGWALMQKDNYVEAEIVYRSALEIAPDNNKLCNLGICLMKQGKIKEATNTLQLVKSTMADGLRGVDSHLKAFERAQKMLREIESQDQEDDAFIMSFLGSSNLWQPQPCVESYLPQFSTKSKRENDFFDENLDPNRTNCSFLVDDNVVFPPLKKIAIANHSGNSLNISAQPYFSRFAQNTHVNQRGIPMVESETEKSKFSIVSGEPEYKRTTLSKDCLRLLPDNHKTSNKFEEHLKNESEDSLVGFLPDQNEFDEALIAAILDCSYDNIQPQKRPDMLLKDTINPLSTRVP